MAYHVKSYNFLEHTNLLNVRSIHSVLRGCFCYLQSFCYVTYVIQQITLSAAVRRRAASYTLAAHRISLVYMLAALNASSKTTEVIQSGSVLLLSTGHTTDFDEVLCIALCDGMRYLDDFVYLLQEIIHIYTRRQKLVLEARDGPTAVVRKRISKRSSAA